MSRLRWMTLAWADDEPSHDLDLEAIDMMVLDPLPRVGETILLRGFVLIVAAVEHNVDLAEEPFQKMFEPSQHVIVRVRLK